MTLTSRGAPGSAGAGSAGQPSRPDGDAKRLFRTVAGRFPTGIAIAATVAGHGPQATTINAFTTVSLEPTLLLVCLDLRSRLLSAIMDSGVFTVTVLAADQQHCAQRFASRGRPAGQAAFDGIAVSAAPATGCPLLSDGVAYFDCRTYQQHPGGDHAMLIGEVASFGLLREVPPLVFVDGRYAGAALGGPGPG